MPTVGHPTLIEQQQIEATDIGHILDGWRSGFERLTFGCPRKLVKG